MLSARSMPVRHRAIRFSAVHVADDERHFGHIRGRESVQCNEVLFHRVFLGYRSSVQQQFCDEVLLRTANDAWLNPSIVI